LPFWVCNFCRKERSENAAHKFLSISSTFYAHVFPQKFWCQKITKLKQIAKPNVSAFGAKIKAKKGSSKMLMKLTTARISSTGLERGRPMTTNPFQQTRAFFFQNWIKTTTESSGANFIDVLRAAFAHVDSEGAKNNSQVSIVILRFWAP